MKHYMISSPKMSITIPIMDDGSGPIEDYYCVCFVEAPNKYLAKILAIKDSLMKEWVENQRSDGANPFTGLRVDDCKCKHGKCWCENCIDQFGECEECLKEA